MRKILALLLTLTMLIGMGAVAMAEDVGVDCVPIPPYPDVTSVNL